MRQLAVLIAQGKLAPPYGDAALQRANLAGESVRVDLESLMGDFSPKQIALVVGIAADERRRVEQPRSHVELVATGPDLQAHMRDTSIVVEQLFGEAKDSVLIVGFAVYDGHAIFKSLAVRMDQEPNLKVVCCLDVARSLGDTGSNGQIVARFGRHFVKDVWPGKRLPAIYYDPRSLATNREARAVLHAKTVVIDRRKALITSANPTPAAYLRNIELGVVITGGDIPADIDKHFRKLIADRRLESLNL